jgi:hypothetical protein
MPGAVTPLHELPLDHAANAYLLGRGHHDPHQLSRALGLAYCPQARPEFALAGGRIIIQVTMQGKLAGWQARILGTPPTKKIPKYWTFPGMYKSRVLYNFDRARQSPLVVIVEGASDVWSVGPRSVALFGKVPSTFQVQLLTRFWGGKAAVVLLNTDAEEQSEALQADLQGRFSHLVRVQLPAGRDPGSYGHQDIWGLIRQAAGQQGVDLEPYLAGPNPAQATNAS